MGVTARNQTFVFSLNCVSPGTDFTLHCLYKTFRIFLSILVSKILTYVLQMCWQKWDPPAHSWLPQKWFSGSITVAESQEMEKHPALLCLRHFTALKMCFCTLATEWKWAGQSQEGGTDYGKVVGQRTQCRVGVQSNPDPKQQTIFQFKHIQSSCILHFLSFLMEKLQFEVICLF